MVVRRGFLAYHSTQRVFKGLVPDCFQRFIDESLVTTRTCLSLEVLDERGIAKKGDQGRINAR